MPNHYCRFHVPEAEQTLFHPKINIFTLENIRGYVQIPWNSICTAESDDKYKGDWLKNWMEKWERDIRVLIKMADKYLQESFSAVDRGGPIGVDISATRNKGYMTGVHGAGNFFAKKNLPCVFFKKSPPLPSKRRISKYVAVKESRTGPTESHDISKGEIKRFSTCKRRADWFSQGKAGFFNCLSYPGS